MKNILILGGLLLVIVGLHAHGACLMKNLELEKSCTGGAAGINNDTNSSILNGKSDDTINRDSLEKIYSPPTMSVPTPYKNGFPMLNQNCTFGTCFPK